MKLELIQEERFGSPWPWFTVCVDGQEVYGSWNKQLVEQMYDQIETEKKFQKSIKTILKSQEIVVSSQENNTINI